MDLSESMRSWFASGRSGERSGFQARCDPVVFAVRAARCKGVVRYADGCVA